MKEGEARQLIVNPLITEKGTGLQEKHNQYLFRVSSRANKLQVKQAIEKIFGVKVKEVRTCWVHGKLRRIGRTAGHKPSWKKAIVTLKEGEKIELK